MADAIDLLIHLKHLAGAIHIQIEKPLMNKSSMSRRTDDISTKWRISEAGTLLVLGLKTQCSAHDEVSDALQIGCRFQTGKQLAGTGFVHACDGFRHPLINLAFEQIEFLFTLLDGQEGHSRRCGQEIAKVERGIASDKAGFQCQTDQIVWGKVFPWRGPGWTRICVFLFQFALLSRWCFAWHQWFRDKGPDGQS